MQIELSVLWFTFKPPFLILCKYSNSFSTAFMEFPFVFIVYSFITLCLLATSQGFVDESSMKCLPVVNMSMKCHCVLSSQHKL